MRMNKQKIIEISNPFNIFETENLFILTEKKIKWMEASDRCEFQWISEND